MRLGVTPVTDDTWELCLLSCSRSSRHFSFSIGGGRPWYHFYFTLLHLPPVVSRIELSCLHTEEFKSTTWWTDVKSVHVLVCADLVYADLIRGQGGTDTYVGCLY